LLPNYPNPFNPSTTLRYALPEAGIVNLTIHDINGREISRIVQDATQQIGYHSVEWNGKDADGRNVGAGIYFAILRSGSESQMIRMVYLK